MHDTFASTSDLALLPPVSPFLAPITGWVLQPLLQLDRHRPGLLAEVTAARTRKRQAIYAALATGALKRPQAYADLLGTSQSWHGAVWPALLAEALIITDPKVLVSTALECSPDGYLTLLARAGPAPLQEDAYARLHAIYVDPRQRRRQRVLSDSEKLTDELLDVVLILPEEALRANVVRACRSAEDAHTVAFAVQHAIAGGRTRIDVAKQLSDFGPRSTAFGAVKALIETFSHAARAPDLSAISGAEVLTSSEAIFRVGRELENCLASIPILWSTSMGEIVYAVLREQRLIVQLHAISGGWLLTGVHKAGNVTVLARERLIACAIFEGAGFPALESLKRSDDAQLVGARLDGVQAQLAFNLD